MLNAANVQILPVSKFNFQWDKVDGKLIIGNIITLETLTAPHTPKRRHKVQYKKVCRAYASPAHLLFFPCAGFGRMMRRDWGSIFTAALQRTAANGRKVWECFMLGVDPTKADDDFKITRFWMENGVPKFEFSHSSDGAGNSFVPRIKTLGKAKLSDSWQEVPSGGNPSFRFFTVEIELP